MKKRLINIITVLLIIISSIIVYIYLNFNFKGTVISKEIVDIPMEFIHFKNYEIEIDTILGTKKYLVENEDIFNTIEVDKEYYFKRQSTVTRIVNVYNEKEEELS